VNRVYKTITFTTYLPHTQKQKVPAFTRTISNYFDRNVRPALEGVGYTASSKMNINNGVGDKEPRDEEYGILILSWKLEEMAADPLVSVVEEAFRSLGAGPTRW